MFQQSGHPIKEEKSDNIRAIVKETQLKISNEKYNEKQKAIFIQEKGMCIRGY